MHCKKQGRDISLYSYPVFHNGKYLQKFAKIIAERHIRILTLMQFIHVIQICLVLPILISNCVCTLVLYNFVTCVDLFFTIVMILRSFITRIAHAALIL